ncbi:tyrosine-type recombinase/integrase [Methylomagnum ishizawai]|uniref:tyrosine-type recombinase/integrase n=1 Tax=Methylomagnum ishizawai TaxID=1760988 RepID=UPI003CCE7C7C
MPPGGVIKLCGAADPLGGNLCVASRADQLAKLLIRLLPRSSGLFRGLSGYLSLHRVDLRANQFILEGHHTKAGKRRMVPLNAAARAAILSRASYRAERCPDSPWVFCNADGERIKCVRRSFKTALRWAGIKNFRQHDQRHSAAVFMSRGGRIWRKSGMPWGIVR